jgi:hypothetical protein
MTDLEKLLAIETIKSLRARYTRFIDTEQWELLPSAFSAAGLPARGRARAWIRIHLRDLRENKRFVARAQCAS